MKFSRILILTSFALIVLIFSANNGIAQKKLTLTPKRGSSVKLTYGARSVTIDLDDALSGNGSMPGNPPHTYRVLFTKEKAGFLFLVANVQSHSPISDKNAPCGGDSPQSMLWIKIDEKLKDPQLENEIYASCSYNYVGTKVKITKTGVSIKYGDPSKDLVYDNHEPEKGFVLESMFANQQPKIGGKP